MPTMMRDAAISFPMFGGLTIDPSATFTLFGHTFYWYGAIIALGFMLGLLYCARRAPRFGLVPDDLYSFVIWALPICIICARLYFVAFDWETYSHDLLSIFKTWNGGLAIYGAVIGGVFTAYFWARAKKIPPLALFDDAVFGLLIGQSVGRWGNFMNREAFGSVTDAFTRMGLTRPGQETVYVHPTFLYESLWNLVGFVLLAAFVRRGHRRYDGQAFLLYVLWYGLGRAWIEGLRTDSLYIGSTGIRVSQALAIISALAAAVALFVAARREHPPLYADRSISPEAAEPPAGA